ncbi:hypothetical protein JDV02_003495 [Purpureocillium takamizusanense]|uniref:Uncharacterized protein n=1 Tax=Purpureocillium takamizusanense TaxID=2060973 RepID=A0A9Q8V9R0_9HYPO|nr:uncharacterized protein JDV02_003495 [Purpureocillium takamizusanense]UNI17119.1 hypothetical protein JDV02_003495 [Purpureocillium takamizusanense]
MGSPASALLFHAAAGVAAVSAAHHAHRGVAELYPAWRARLVGVNNDGRAAARAARTGWDYMMVGYALTVLLNVKWARAGGPRGWEEGAALAALALGGLREGWVCARAGEALPLVAFWGVPALGVLATALS